MAISQTYQTFRARLIRAVRYRLLRRGSEAVFVFGCPRSGTSVLAWALASHPDFWTSDESDFIHYLCGDGKLHQAYQKSCSRADGGWLTVNQVPYIEFAAAIGAGIDEMFLARAGYKRWIDSDPGYVLMAEDLAMMFPRAKFLHIVRDGRAVVASMLHSRFNEVWATDIRLACEAWVHYVRTGLKFQKNHPERAMQVNLEKLTADLSTEFGLIFDFLGARPHRGPIEFVRSNRINSSYGNSAPADMRLPKQAASLPKRPWSQWDTDAIRHFTEVAGPLMLELGYPIDSSWVD